MNNSMLLVVHLGYGRYRGLDRDEGYGNYNNYISRLEKAVWFRDSIIFTYMRDTVPFILPPNAYQIYDDRRTREEIKEEVVSRLKSKNVSDVDICGEFLWWYTFDTPCKFSDGCITTVVEDLKNEFHVKLLRDLCYPTVKHENEFSMKQYEKIIYK
jgi:hypothetical protein